MGKRTAVDMIEENGVRNLVTLPLARILLDLAETLPGLRKPCPDCHDGSIGDAWISCATCGGDGLRGEDSEQVGRGWLPEFSLEELLVELKAANYECSLGSFAHMETFRAWIGKSMGDLPAVDAAGPLEAAARAAHAAVVRGGDVMGAVTWLRWKAAGQPVSMAHAVEGAWEGTSDNEELVKGCPTLCGRYPCEIGAVFFGIGPQRKCVACSRRAAIEPAPREAT